MTHKPMTYRGIMVLNSGQWIWQTTKWQVTKYWEPTVYLQDWRYILTMTFYGHVRCNLNRSAVQKN